MLYHVAILYHILSRERDTQHIVFVKSFNDAEMWGRRYHSRELTVCTKCWAWPYEVPLTEKFSLFPPSKAENRKNGDLNV